MDEAVLVPMMGLVEPIAAPSIGQPKPPNPEEIRCADQSSAERFSRLPPCYF
jgi:hypothetical protein